MMFPNSLNELIYCMYIFPWTLHVLWPKTRHSSARSPREPSAARVAVRQDEVGRWTKKHDKTRVWMMLGWFWDVCWMIFGWFFGMFLGWWMIFQRVNFLQIPSILRSWSEVMQRLGMWSPCQESQEKEKEPHMARHPKLWIYLEARFQ